MYLREICVPDFPPPPHLSIPISILIPTLLSSFRSVRFGLFDLACSFWRVRFSLFFPICSFRSVSFDLFLLVYSVRSFLFDLSFSVLTPSLTQCFIPISLSAPFHSEEISSYLSHSISFFDDEDYDDDDMMIITMIMMMASYPKHGPALECGRISKICWCGAETRLHKPQVIPRSQSRLV